MRKKKGRITNSDYQTLNDISRRAITNNTNKLKEMGLIKRVGSAKGGFWEITKKTKR